MSARYYKMRSGGVVYPARLVEDPARGADPVVVIDPEDREQVDRLERLMADNCGWSRSEPMRTQRADGLEEALRFLIAPPKPPEPKEFAALAVERDGTVWHRVRDAESDGHRFPWATRDSCASWNRLDIVAVYPAPKPEVIA